MVFVAIIDQRLSETWPHQLW